MKFYRFRQFVFVRKGTQVSIYIAVLKVKASWSCWIFKEKT